VSEANRINHSEPHQPGLIAPAAIAQTVHEDASRESYMPFINGITLLLLYQLAGEICVLLLGLPLPGPVLGMIMLLITLIIRGRVDESLDGSSTALLSHLSLLFVPAGVGIMVHFERIAGEWLPITVALLLSTLVTMAATAAIMLLATRLLTGRAGDNG
jgi:holin-like protein